MFWVEPDDVGPRDLFNPSGSSLSAVFICLLKPNSDSAFQAGKVHGKSSRTIDHCLQVFKAS